MEQIESKIEKEEGEPIVDIEINKEELEIWQKGGLRGDIIFSLENFEELAQPNSILSLHPISFETTKNFIGKTVNMFAGFEAENLEEKMKEVENEAQKAVLNFTFDELGFDPENPEIIEQKKIRQNNKELIIRYFKTNQENVILVSDGIDWWLERK